MIWAKQSVLLAVGLAAMVPAMAPRSTPNTRPAAGDSHQAAVGTTLTATDALARAQAACEIGHGGTTSATQVSQLVRLLADDTRVETPECNERHTRAGQKDGGLGVGGSVGEMTIAD